MRPTEKKIQNLIQNLKENTQPELDARILDNCFTELNTQKSTPTQGQNIWRTIMYSKITKPIAAAIIIIAGFLSLTIFDKTVPQAYAIEQTAAAMKKTHNVHGIFIDRQGRRVNAWGQINPDTGMITVMRLEYEDGGLYIITKDQTYFEDDGLVAVKEGQYMKCGLLFNDFISEAAQKMYDQGMMKTEKQYSEEFQCEVICVDIKQPQVHLQAIVDIETKLPIKFSIPWVSYPNEPLDYTELIEYNLDLPPGFFEFETGPDAIVIGSHLDNQFANDPNFGIAYDDNEDLQQVCKKLAAEYLQARIDGNIEKIKQFHPIYISRYGSSKMIEKMDILDRHQNGSIVEVLSIEDAYEYKGPQRMQVPCRIIKEHKGKQLEVLVGVSVYLRGHNGPKSAVVVGYFPKLQNSQSK